MEIKDLKGFVLLLVLVGMVLGAGILILDRFGSSDAVTQITRINDENLTWGGAINSTETLSKGNLTSLISLSNETDGTPALSSSNYTIVLLTGIITVKDNSSICKANLPCYATYDYTNYDTPTSSALASVRDAIAEIPSTWLSLIVTIAVLAIILVLIIRSFGGGRD